RLLVELDRIEHVDHLAVERGAHGVALVRAVEGDPGDAALHLDRDGLPAILVVRHAMPPLFPNLREPDTIVSGYLRSARLGRWQARKRQPPGWRMSARPRCAPDGGRPPRSRSGRGSATSWGGSTGRCAGA